MYRNQSFLGAVGSFKMSILVTGGAGFIGSNFIKKWFNLSDETVINLDRMSYGSDIRNLSSFEEKSSYIFVEGDIANKSLVENLLLKHQPTAIFHFAAESHVDRSISGPSAFVQTNILGTFNLLDVSLKYWKKLDGRKKSRFRFFNISTDEVYGSLTKDAATFDENHRFSPNSPYSASKAAADHLARAYFQTYTFPCLTTNCSNNYGPFQFHEKLIPLVIKNALNNKKIPIYGDGLQIRDWLYVEDHCDALLKLVGAGKPGEVYNIGGDSELTNLEVVHSICSVLDDLQPNRSGSLYCEQIEHVTDRAGHDRRYGINCQKIYNEVGWAPSEKFSSGLIKTIRWYLNNLDRFDC